MLKVDWAEFIQEFNALRLGSGSRNRVPPGSSKKFKTSGSSEAWYRARFGTERSRVRIPPSPPLTDTVGCSNSEVEHRGEKYLRACWPGELHRNRSTIGF